MRLTNQLAIAATIQLVMSMSGAASRFSEAYAK
jgi:hypothetical protein